MPATAERPRPVPIPSYDEPVPPRRRSPPPFTKLPDTKPVSPPPSSLPSTPKPVLSPRTEKKAPLSPPPDVDPKKLDKVDPKPDPPSPSAPESTTDSKAESKPPLEKAPEATDNEADIIDMETFQQIRELDDEESDEFSREMVYAFFTQAEDTFKSMDGALQSKDLAELSALGHFLKGSSAALGVRKVQNSCENIQHYGKLRDEEANIDLKPEEALRRIGSLLVQVKKEYLAAERLLKKLYTPHTP